MIPEVNSHLTLISPSPLAGPTDASIGHRNSASW